MKCTIHKSLYKLQIYTTPDTYKINLSGKEISSEFFSTSTTDESITCVPILNRQNTEKHPLESVNKRMT